MSANKRTVGKYLDGFNKLDHGQILSCLADDVEWEIPGFFHIHGKEAYDKEIESEAFVGKPEIAALRLVEENDVVIAEGTVRARKKDNSPVNIVFCDVFVMKGGLIRKLTSYLMEVRR